MKRIEEKMDKLNKMRKYLMILIKFSNNYLN